MAPSVDIIIVNWNTGPQLQVCLRSIAESERTGLAIGRVNVVDNASVDGSADDLDPGDLPLVIERNLENRGFAAACNQGAARTRSDYLLFLNPDTALFRESLVRPLTFMEDSRCADVGICGVRLIGDGGATVVACARFPTLATFFGQATGLSYLWPRVFRPHLMSADECQTTRDVDQIIGAFFLVRRALYQQLGGFDERFFVYFEEVDFSLRARHCGYRSVYLSDVSVYHRGGLSSEQVKASRLFYSLRSRLQYGFKHYSRLEAALLVAVTAGVELVSRLVRAVAHRSIGEAQEVVSGYLALSGYLVRVFLTRSPNRAT